MKNATANYVTIRSERHLLRLYVLCDLLSTNVAWLLFDMMRYHLLQATNAGYSSLGSFLLSKTVVIGQIIFPLMMMCLYWLSGYYNDIYRRSRLQEAMTTAGSAVLGSLTILLVALVNDLTGNRNEDYLLIAWLFGILFAVVYIPRLIITSGVMRRLRDGRLRQASLAVLTPSGIEADELALPPSMGIEVVCVLYAMADGTLTDKDGNDADVERLCIDNNIRYVLLGVSEQSGLTPLLESVARLYRATDVPILVTPTANDIVNRRYGTGHLWPAGRHTVPANIDAEPLCDISRPALSASTLNLKRAGDVVLSIAGLVMTFVPVLILAAAVKATSRGGAFYRQTRIGLRGRKFEIIKLRTMRDGAEADGPTLSSEGDPRITPLGHWLRKYRLDELPQFWNVLRGDMSMVGPRPEREYYVKQLIERQPAYALVHQVRPGITSLGMVKYGYAGNVDEMLERMRFDLLYIENIGVTLDLKVLFYTFHTVFTGKGL